MPSSYAHYRFGAAMLEKMPGDIRRTVKRFRQLYDMGLHGPDIFFFYNPFISTPAGKLGTRFHRQTGAEFFARVCRSQRLEPTEAGLAYLYGVLCHYCLDSVCHPYVHEKAAQGPATHTQIETEFERFLLETDGKTPPHTQDISPHMRLTPGECSTVFKFYPGASAAVVRDSVRNMAFFTKLLSSPQGAKRTLLNKGIGLAGKETAGKLMLPEPDPLCGETNEALMALYAKAAERYPVLLEQLAAHMAYNAPFGEEFSADFG